MPSQFGTVSVGIATTPSVIGTFFSHYLNKRSKKKIARKNGVEDPNLELAYDEGIKTIKAFLEFSSKHTLEETQVGTSWHRILYSQADERYRPISALLIVVPLSYMSPETSPLPPT